MSTLSNPFRNPFGLAYGTAFFLSRAIPAAVIGFPVRGAASASGTDPSANVPITPSVDPVKVRRSMIVLLFSLGSACCHRPIT